MKQILIHKEENKKYLVEKEKKRLEEEKRTLVLMEMQKSSVNTNAVSKLVLVFLNC
jgi:hypothetical protein